MASLTKNGNTYGLIWTDNSRTPRQVGESLKTSSKKQAKRRKARLENEYFEGNHDPWHKKWYQHRREGRAITIHTAVEEFIKYKESARGAEAWNKSTAKREKYVLRKFARHVGDIFLNSLTSAHLEDFYYREGVTSDHTRKGDYISVNTLLNWCISRGYLEEKPTFKPSKPQRKIPKFIYPEELAGVVQYRLGLVRSYYAENKIKTGDGRWIPLVWLLMAGTGVRRKELVRIKRNNIERNSILIGADFTTKVRSERRVPLLFESGWAVRQLSEIDSGSPYLTGKAPNYAADKLTNTFTACWQGRYPNKPRRTLYGLKDSFAARFLADDSVGGGAGIKINELKDILGHASLSTTEKYLKALPYGLTISDSVWDYIERF